MSIKDEEMKLERQRNCDDNGGTSDTPGFVEVGAGAGFGFAATCIIIMIGGCSDHYQSTSTNDRSHLIGQSKHTLNNRHDISAVLTFDVFQTSLATLLIQNQDEKKRRTSYQDQWPRV